MMESPIKMDLGVPLFQETFILILSSTSLLFDGDM